MEFNLHIDPLFGDLYLLIKSHPYRDSNILSSIDNASKPELVSIEDKDDENFPMDKNLPKDKTREIIPPKIPALNMSDINGPSFIMPP